MTGDTPSNIMWRETMDGQMNYTKALTDSIARNMPGIPAYPAIGNHGNQRYDVVNHEYNLAVYVGTFRPGLY